MEKAGEQGLLGASVPEEFGGLGKDFITSTLVNEGLGGGYSFSVAIAPIPELAHCLFYILVPKTKKKIHSQTCHRRMERLLWTNRTR